MKKQVGKKGSTVCTNRYADCLFKNTSIKDNKYVVNQKLEHVDDISFREHFDRIRVVFFLQNMIYPFLPQCICIYVDHYFSYETQLLAKKYGQQISNSQVQTMIAKETNINNVVWKYVILFIVFIMRDYDSVFFTREMLTQLYGRLGIVLNRGKLLYCRIITLRGDA
jgi:hypothetical protein